MSQDEFTNIAIKGFVVPSGYTLLIEKEGKIYVKDSGEFSGGHYKLSEVHAGSIPGWKLQRKEQEEAPYTPLSSVSGEVYSIMDSIRQAGGTPVFVGGVVRDSQMGLDSKDVDIEVYGIPSENLEKLLGAYGKVDMVGASFGIIKLTTESGDYDFNLPRRENKEGAGHRGFIVEADPTMTPQEAALRRDFTINSLSLTPEGKLLDYYGGKKDIEERRLRHISEKFSEDPLRVLRGFQFAARFDFSMAPETVDLAKKLKAEYKTLAQERIWGEWQKWAVKGVKPSAGLQVLLDTGWVDFYPEIKALVGVPQEEEWHPEGSVMNHTLHVVDAAADIAERENLTPEDRTVLLLAALCHDLGKPTTTENIGGKWRAPGHDKAGRVPSLMLLDKIGAPASVTEKVIPLVMEHMAHLNEINQRSVRRLATRLFPASIEMLSFVIEADHSGRPPLPKGLPESARRMVELAKDLRIEFDKPSPILGGKHLMNMAESGEIPAMFKKGGPHFKRVLDVMFEAQLDGIFDNEESGVQYLRSVLIEEEKRGTQEKYVFLAQLSKQQKRNLISQCPDMTEHEIISLPLEQLRKLV